MTEQEKREQEMDKIAIHLMGLGYFRDRAEMVAQDILPYMAERIIEKEKEIFAKCKEKCMFQGYPYGIDYTELVEVFKEFGVEVEK